jgi:hypothetical protein
MGMYPMAETLQYTKETQNNTYTHSEQYTTQNYKHNTQHKITNTVFQPC